MPVVSTTALGLLSAFSLLIAGTRSEDAHFGLDWERGGQVHVRLGISRGHPAKHEPSPPLGWRDILWLREQALVMVRQRRVLHFWHPSKALLAWTSRLTDMDWEYGLHVVRNLSFPSLVGNLWDSLRHPPPRDGGGDQERVGHATGTAPTVEDAPGMMHSRAEVAR